VTYDGPGEFWPTYYHSHNQTAETMPFLARSTYLMVRTAENPARTLPAIRQITAELDPTLAIASTYTQDEVLGEAVARPRFIMSILTFFAAVALLLGTIGIYGVISYGVALRAGEIGIRRALGADAPAVVGMVLGQGFFLSALGVMLGLAGAWGGTRIMVGFLHAVSPTDPITFLSVGLGVLAIALFAAFLPARRAGGVDPLEALRVE
jgi:ABC-type antimicrobial peptide transport system permease subunit